MSPFLIVDVEFLSNKDVGMLVESSGNCRPYALNEFPSQLVLFGKKFTIMGVVAHRPGHYVAYTHRLDNRWEVLDDLANEIVICNESERISPHIIMYATTREEQQRAHLQRHQHEKGSPANLFQSAEFGL
ncbi:hypothetical protein J6590_091732, partial [Homalodisca vitripennis]